jgi:hypothetical protein
MNGEDIDAHKLQYFPATLQGKNASWFIHYETTTLLQPREKFNVHLFQDLMMCIVKDKP